MDEVDKEMLKFLKTTTKTSTEDEYYHFGMSISNELRSMTPMKAGMAKIRITQLLFDLKYSEQVIVLPADGDGDEITT